VCHANLPPVVPHFSYSSSRVHCATHPEAETVPPGITRERSLHTSHPQPLPLGRTAKRSQVRTCLPVTIRALHVQMFICTVLVAQASTSAARPRSLYVGRRVTRATNSDSLGRAARKRVPGLAWLHTAWPPNAQVLLQDYRTKISVSWHPRLWLSNTLEPEGNSGLAHALPCFLLGLCGARSASISHKDAEPL